MTTSSCSEAPPTVWDVLVGQHKDKNLFDLIVKVEPRRTESGETPKSSVISLSSHDMRDLNVSSRIERPFEEYGADGEQSDNNSTARDSNGDDPLRPCGEREVGSVWQWEREEGRTGEHSEPEAVSVSTSLEAYQQTRDD